MTRTDELIRRLAADGAAAAQLPPPPRRLVTWFAVSVPYVALAVLVATPREDLADRMADARFLVEQLGALATALTAALAAFSAIIPGLPLRRLLLPLVPLGIWVGSLGQGVISACLQGGMAALKLMPDLICFPAILAVSAVPAMSMLAMLRQGVPLLPKVTVVFGALAATALGNFGLRLFHPQDASLMVLVWQFGTVVLLTGLAGAFGHRLLPWRHAAAA